MKTDLRPRLHGRGCRGSLVLGLLLLLLPAPALAQGGVEVTPWAGFVFGGSLLELSTGDVLYVSQAAGFGFIVDLPKNSRADYELIYSLQRTELTGDDVPGEGRPPELDIHYLHVGGRYEYPRERVRPFLSGGFGLTALVPDGSGQDWSTHFSFSLGGGVRIPLSERVGLRLEGRGYLTLLTGDTRIACVSSAGGACAVGTQGDGLGQFEVLAGLYFKL